MDRNMRSSYINSGPRSLPHMGSGKRHTGNGHNGARLSPPMPPRLSPPTVSHSHSSHSAHNVHSQHDELISYVYDSWNKVTRELENGSDEARYYQPDRPPVTFRPFNLEEWWTQTINRNKHRS